MNKMKLKNVKIGTQILFGIIIILGLFVTIGLVSHYQTERIHEQTTLLYEHPLQVRRAVGILNSNIQKMRIATRDLMLAINDQEREKALKEMEIATYEAEEMFDKIKLTYLGPKSDVEEAFTAYLNWKIERNKNTKLAFVGDIQSIKKSVDKEGEVGKLRDIMMKKINIIDQFAKNKGDEIYRNSELLLQDLTWQLIIYVSFALLVTCLIYFLFINYIRNPIKKLTLSTISYAKGDHKVRSQYHSKNEIGDLSKAFDTLAENIMLNEELNEKTTFFSNEMVLKDDAKEFFKLTLHNLMVNTDAQIGSVYLLNENKEGFVHYISIGTNKRNKEYYSIKDLEGEYGISLVSQKIKYFKDLAGKIDINFTTLYGDYFVNEIVVIPIVNYSEVIALISLATIHKYTNSSIEFIEKIYHTYSARIEGVLAYRKIIHYAQELQNEKDNLTKLNQQLEIQKEILNEKSNELSQQNQELEVQKEQLNEVNKLKTSFLSNMSHELRTPLNSVIALSGVLSRKLKDQISEEEYSYLDVIQRNGKNLLTMINDILDISRIEAGKEEIDITSFNLCECVNEVVEMIKPQILEKNLELDLAKGDCHVDMRSDIKKVKHIVQNIISNAVKFTEKGKISISLSQVDQMIHLNIQDTGIGIKKEHLKHIFDEFRQADSGTARKYGGTGLGLSIAKKYAELLGGYIKVESEENKGSIFSIILPIHSDGNIDTKPKDSGEPILKNHSINAEKMMNQNISILLVDDSDPAIIQMSNFLEESGFEVIIAKNGNEALLQMEKKLPNAIILDLMMPELDGFSLLKMIRDDEITKNIPVLILTAKHITKDEMSFLKKNNIFQCIQKGDIHKNEFMNAVMNMVMNHK